MIKVSVIILSWNTKEILKSCLESLIKSLEITPLNYEIIVVDNASSDGSGLMTKNQFPEVKLIGNKINLGYAKANNQGLKMAKGEFIFFLNSDTLVKPEAVTILVNYLEKNKDTAAVSPLILNHDGAIQKDPSYLRLPSCWIALFYYHKLSRSLIFKYCPTLFLSTNDFSKTQEVEQLSGAALMARRQLLNKLKGFDENFYLYFEDSDLSLRMKRLNLKLKVVPSSQIIHLGGESAKNFIKSEGRNKYYLLNFKSLFYFCDKNYSYAKASLIKLIIRINLLLTFKIDLLKKLSQE